MFRKLLAAALFAAACSVTVYADAAEEAPAPRPVGDKKPGDGPGGKFGGKFGPEKFKGKIDPEKLEALKGKFKDLDPEKKKELLEKFKGKGGFDPEKFKGKFKKGGDE